MKKINNTKSKVIVLKYSHFHPSEFKKENYLVKVYKCVGKDEKKMNKIITIINENAIKIRTDKLFWEKVLTQYAKDFKLPYEDPEHFYETSELFKQKKELDRGDFDLFY